MTDLDENALKEVFEAIDEEERLSKELTEKSKAYQYLMDIEAFLGHTAFALDKIKVTLEFVGNAQTPVEVLDGIAGLGFYVFSFGSTHLSLENLLYGGACNLEVADVVHPLLDEWKYSVSVQVMKAYRNRLQHRHYAVPNLKVEPGRLIIPPDLVAASDFSIREDELERIVEGNPGQKWSARSMQSILAARDSGQAAQGSMVLLERYRDDFVAVVSGDHGCFRRVAPTRCREIADSGTGD